LGSFYVPIELRYQARGRSALINMMRFLVGLVRQVIKIAIVVAILVVLAIHAYVHTSIRVQGQRVAFNGLVTWPFVIVAGCSILVIDVFDNRRNRREGQPLTETWQFLIDQWGTVRTLWHVKNLFYAALYVLLAAAIIPTFYAWITNPNNASAVNALGTGVLAVLTLLYVVLTGYLVRGNTRWLRAQSDANVVVYDTSPGENGKGYPELIVQNMGPVTARDVRLRVRLPDDPLSAYLGSLSTSRDAIQVGSLLPHQSAVLPLRSVPTDLLQREEPFTYTVTATWTLASPHNIRPVRAEPAVISARAPCRSTTRPIGTPSRPASTVPRA